MQEQKYSIKSWAKDDRPREKLLLKGTESLSDSELLAILIHNGTREKTAVDLAKQILKLGKNNLAELGKLSVKDLMKVKGIGEAKAVTIAAAMEMGRRIQTMTAIPKLTVSSSREIAAFLQPQLKELQQEVFGVLFLNQANKINHFEIVSKGGITATVADPKIILKKALEANAVSIILCHNHPSGNTRPSQADEELTQKIQAAAKLFDIKVLDHIIVSESGYYSFADEGLL